MVGRSFLVHMKNINRLTLDQLWAFAAGACLIVPQHTDEVITCCWRGIS